MSFFFDVWTSRGFVLASDVQLTRGDEVTYMHKMACGPRNGRVPCAIVTCGEYPGVSLSHFMDAACRKDTLREIAHAFAKRWTRSFADTRNYSAVHLVGYERIPDSSDCVPQMWFWCNWDASPERYLNEGELRRQLDSFAQPIPHNNHIPQFIKSQEGRFPSAQHAAERSLVMDWLIRHGPHFTWNGDIDFWRSAASTVQSVTQLLRPQPADWALDTTWKLTKLSLEFLADVATFLTHSTVSLSPARGCDVLVVTPEGVEMKAWACLSEDPPPTLAG